MSFISYFSKARREERKKRRHIMGYTLDRMDFVNLIDHPEVYGFVNDTKDSYELGLGRLVYPPRQFVLINWVSGPQANTSHWYSAYRFEKIELQEEQDD